MREKIKQLPKSIFLYLIFAVAMIAVLSLKEDYYVDEIYTYGLSNYTGDGIDMGIEYHKTYEPAASLYEDYMQVGEGERFDYANVWEKQAGDVHPPLYYAIVHTICSLFPGTYSLWYAGAVNIAAALLTLFVVRKLAGRLSPEPYFRTVLSVAFVCTAGILTSVVYLRMYVLAMFWVTLLAWLFVRQVGEKQGMRFYVQIYLAAVAGALTHYYVVMYIVCLSCVYGGCFCGRSDGRRRRSLD